MRQPTGPFSAFATCPRCGPSAAVLVLASNLTRRRHALRCEHGHEWQTAAMPLCDPGIASPRWLPIAVVRTAYTQSTS